MEIPAAQDLIFDEYPDSLVEVWMLNADAERDWFDAYTADYGLHLPIMQHADSAFVRFHLGREWRELPPLYIVIDRQGIIRHRSWGQGSVSLETVAEMVGELLEQ